MSKNNTNYHITPTEKQKEYLKLRLEYGGNISKQQLLKKAGYSDAMSKNPQKVEKSKGFQKLLRQEVDDKKIVRRFNEIVEDGKEHNSINAGKELLKLKDRYPSKKHDISISRDQEELVE